METGGEDPQLALRGYCEIFPYQEDVVAYAMFLLSGVLSRKEVVDRYIDDASEHWKLGRITHVDKNVLRIGIYEMLFSEDVPPKVAIDEAIELGKKYGNEDSKDFVNGILDKVLRDHYKKRAPIGIS